MESLPYGGKHLSLPGVEGFLRFEIAGWKPGSPRAYSRCSVLGDASWHEELASNDQAACEVPIILPLGAFKRGDWKEECGGPAYAGKTYNQLSKVP